MREQIKDNIRLQHILDACDTLTNSGAEDSIESIQNSPVKFYGYVKLVEIIGEETYKLTKDFRAEHPEIPWNMMEGMRYVLVHDYYRINPDKLWNTIQNDIPILREKISELLTKA